MVNIKMKLFHPPRKLSYRLAAKILKPGKLRGVILSLWRCSAGSVFFSRQVIVWHPIGPPGCHYGPESGFGGYRKMMKRGGRSGFYMTSTDFWELLIQPEISEVLIPRSLYRMKIPGASDFLRQKQNGCLWYPE